MAQQANWDVVRRLTKHFVGEINSLGVAGTKVEETFIAGNGFVIRFSDDSELEFVPRIRRDAAS